MVSTHVLNVSVTGAVSLNLILYVFTSSTRITVEFGHTFLKKCSLTESGVSSPGSIGPPTIGPVSQLKLHTVMSLGMMRLTAHESGQGYPRWDKFAFIIRIGGAVGVPYVVSKHKP